MKILKITTLIAVLALGLKAQADGLYDITFTDGGVNVGSGQIDVESGYAVSGYFDVTAGIASGNFTLAGGTAVYPSTITSPKGGFFYDNAVFFTSNPQYPTTNPFLDGNGLLFIAVGGNEINLWGNADGSYSLYGDITGNGYDPQAIGVSSITPTPEPSSLALIALMLVPAGVFLRHNRKAQLPQ
jgi:hypothetical protein